MPLLTATSAFGLGIEEAILSGVTCTVSAQSSAEENENKSTVKRNIQIAIRIYIGTINRDADAAKLMASLPLFNEEVLLSNANKYF